MKYIWITGANGFIGRHLSKHLSNAGYYIVGIGHGHWSYSDQIYWGVKHWFNVDVTKSNLIQIYADLKKVDGIYHLAGGSSVGVSWLDPYTDFKKTVDSTVELLEWVRLNVPLIPLVAVSSAAVYGAGHTGLIKEDDKIIPYSPYGSHKFMMEELCRYYAENFGLCITIPRLFSVYGPGLRKQLLWDTCNQFLKFGKAELGGSGNEMRDWTYVADVTLALEKMISFSDRSAPVFNLATGCPVMVRDVTHILAQTWSYKKPPDIYFNGLSRVGDPECLCADVTKLVARNISSCCSLEQGIQNYVSWFKSVR